MKYTIYFYFTFMYVCLSWTVSHMYKMFSTTDAREQCQRSECREWLACKTANAVSTIYMCMSIRPIVPFRVSTALNLTRERDNGTTLL